LKLAAVDWYSSTVSDWHRGSTGDPPTIGHDSSHPR
jgi:hypothetical protein